MTIEIIGSGDDSRPKTPTLRQFHEITGGKLPKRSPVVILFEPGKIPNFTLVTSHDFKVNVHKDHALFHLLQSRLPDWAERGVALSVIPSKERPGVFELAIDGGKQVGWKRESWGYRIDAE